VYRAVHPPVGTGQHDQVWLWRQAATAGEEGLGVCQDCASLQEVRREWAFTRLRRVAEGEEGAGVYLAAPPSRWCGEHGRQLGCAAFHEERRVWASLGAVPRCRR
jgi:hypothetical protein